MFPQKARHYWFRIRYEFYVISLCFFLTILLFSACNKNSEPVPPTIHFKTGSGYSDTDRMAGIGEQFSCGIVAAAGDAAITNLIITVTTENGTGRALDSGMYTHLLDFDKAITYGPENFEKWTFTVRDKNGKTASVSFTLTKDSNSVYGQISYYPSIVIGCQDNTTDGQFLFLPSGKTGFVDTATAKQAETYLIAYYGINLSPATGMTFSSPGETDVSSFYTPMTGWGLPKNEIRFKFDSLSISPSEFDLSANDSLIISNYTATTSGKRKSKWVQPGYVIPFQVTAGNLAGKRGLIKVKSVTTGFAGKIVFDLKIQE